MSMSIVSHSPKGLRQHIIHSRIQIASFASSHMWCMYIQLSWAKPIICVCMYVRCRRITAANAFALNARAPPNQSLWCVYISNGFNDHHKVECAYPPRRRRRRCLCARCCVRSVWRMNPGHQRCVWHLSIAREPSRKSPMVLWWCYGYRKRRTFTHIYAVLIAHNILFQIPFGHSI